MADFGAIAGGIGVFTSSVQLLDSIIKLKSFIDEFREAPNEIRSMIEEIELMGMLLAEYDSKTQVAYPKQQSCQPSPLSLGKLESSLKEGSVDKLQERLKSADFLLVMATQMHHTLV
ncbi:hypothetical protein BKA65DRAFT_558103 [Rhexocercosporidium sp. MPI-PUGE-AT-0058]|nr:hypothetical protein BKA65DRAFT_558103 [Rhexocercosporidium sp. MPI-PUGE-AT-0058]